MKKSYISILLLLMVMILGISAVSAADIDDTSDLALTQDDSTILEVEDTSEEVQAASDTEVIADSGEGNNFTSLKTLINEAGSSLTLTKDYTRVAGDSDIEINKDFTIDGQDTYTIDANNLGGIFKVNTGYTLTLTGVTLINGNSDNGGAVYVENGATLNAEDCKFNQNTAVYRGGAIYSEGGVNIVGSVFDSNNITFRTKNDDNGGAAVYNYNGVLSIVDSNITNNLKDIVIRNGNAGDLLVGVVVTSGETVIKGSYFANNAGSWGGAISSLGYLNTESYTLTVMDSKFEGNNATFGGAIFVESSNLEVYNCTFENDSFKNFVDFQNRFRF